MQLGGTVNAVEGHGQNDCSLHHMKPLFRALGSSRGKWCVFLNRFLQ